MKAHYAYHMNIKYQPFLIHYKYRFRSHIILWIICNKYQKKLFSNLNQLYLFIFLQFLIEFILSIGIGIVK